MRVRRPSFHRVAAIAVLAASRAAAAQDGHAVAQGTVAVALRDSAPVRDSAAAPAPVAPAAPALPAALANLKLNGLLQVWYFDGTSDKQRTFRIRRMELKLSGAPVKRVAWTVMVDAAKVSSLGQRYTTVNGSRVLAEDSVNAATQILQDANIAVTFGKAHTITVGQQRVPLSAEGTISPTLVETVDRALFLSDRRRGGALGDVRDVGVAMRGSLASAVEYAGGVFNGTGETQNATVNDGHRAFAARFVLRTPKNGLRIGTSGATGGEPTSAHPRRDRLGGDVQLVRGPVTLRGELMRGTDGATHRRGAYGIAAYRLPHAVTLAARLDTFDPDVHADADAATARTRDIVAAATRAFGNGFTMQGDVVRRSYAHALAPSMTLVRLNVQTTW